ncbi:hypothetical protein AUC69_12295 [Methyloceanibacter superfactus]|uniref:Uncharacterized protein n=1 Tax=Methyloceanibacter superfactus TaxID=1774969 RepID=A0A1E3VV36_9HYPH|nr:hypothetical protein AUC69_12295 [Methyloceanibacter superfactus]
MLGPVQPEVIDNVVALLVAEKRRVAIAAHTDVDGTAALLRAGAKDLRVQRMGQRDDVRAGAAVKILTGLRQELGGDNVGMASLERGDLAGHWRVGRVVLVADESHEARPGAGAKCGCKALQVFGGVGGAVVKQDDEVVLIKFAGETRRGEVENVEGRRLEERCRGEGVGPVVVIGRAMRIAEREHQCLDGVSRCAHAGSWSAAARVWATRV